MNDKIIIKNAREHNLKSVSLELPRNKLIVFTGVSGSGKSSLAFDTIFAEGQRRYMESLSTYARQFIGQISKPDVESIEGLSPAISIDQKTTSSNPRSTVGTITEIYDYMRLLFAHIGEPHCPQCGRPIRAQSVQEIVDNIQKLPEKAKFIVLSPVVKGKKGTHKDIVDGLKKEGFARLKVDGTIYNMDEVPELAKTKEHDIDIVVDRLTINPEMGTRLSDSVSLALKKGSGLMKIELVDEKREVVYSEHFSCPVCNISIEEITPRVFSFNSHHGACPECHGIGFYQKISIDKLIPDRSKTLGEGALNLPFSGGSSNKPDYYTSLIFEVSMALGIKLDVPFEKLHPNQQNIILYGVKGKIPVKQEYYGREYTRNITFSGIMNILEDRYKTTDSSQVKEVLERLMDSVPCNLCHGTRLKSWVTSITIADKSIADVCALSLIDLRGFFEKLKLNKTKQLISEQILREINARLTFLIDVGLSYLSLDRLAGTLSGGEAQRIRLATQIGSGLVGVLYILDEPSIGLHQKDNDRLIATLKRLQSLGNTVIVVEHDEDTIRTADFVVDMGPGAGIHGGHIISAGTLDELLSNKKSITAQYLNKDIHITPNLKPRAGNGKEITLKGATLNNLKNIDATIPLGKLVVVTGVSGSGKSTLINDLLQPALAYQLNNSAHKPHGYKELTGVENIDKVITVDQSPIGRTPRSNPVTYIGAFDYIRNVFSMTNEAKARGYQVGRFSFNVKGGRCEACDGDGVKILSMNFLPDVYVPCEVCNGARYNKDTLEIKYKGKNIKEVLDMNVEEALEFFENISAVKNKLETLYDVGLGYITLGQSSTTLSGGEAQRVKLANELSKRPTGKTVYILDEPTTGLHFADVHKLINILNRLVNSGNSVIVIEHNMDLIKCADHIIDLGPEGGIGGGQVIALGTVKDICASKKSYTGQFLKKYI